MTVSRAPRVTNHTGDHPILTKTRSGERHHWKHKYARDRSCVLCPWLSFAVMAEPHQYEVDPLIPPAESPTAFTQHTVLGYRERHVSEKASAELRLTIRSNTN
eukprot:5291405-Pleurochrysis_carterae.AAC.2